LSRGRKKRPVIAFSFRPSYRGTLSSFTIWLFLPPVQIGFLSQTARIRPRSARRPWPRDFFRTRSSLGGTSFDPFVSSPARSPSMVFIDPSTWPPRIISQWRRPPPLPHHSESENLRSVRSRLLPESILSYPLVTSSFCERVHSFVPPPPGDLIECLSSQSSRS